MSVLLQSMSPLEVLLGVVRRLVDSVSALSRIANVKSRVAAGERADVRKAASIEIKGGANGKPRVLEARRLRLERRQMRTLLI